jgi:hypothetical protein
MDPRNEVFTLKNKKMFTGRLTADAKVTSFNGHVMILFCR